MTLAPCAFLCKKRVQACFLEQPSLLSPHLLLRLHLALLPADFLARPSAVGVFVQPGATGPYALAERAGEPFETFGGPIYVFVPQPSADLTLLKSVGPEPGSQLTELNHFVGSQRAIPV